MLISTCNRTEVYARADRFHAGVGAITEYFADLAGLDPAVLEPHLTTYFDDGAVAHLFTVSAGLDSLVLGEHEILGQVRTAWQRATDEGTAGSSVAAVFRHALEVGKRARTETAIGRHSRSVSAVAVQLAEQRLGTLHDRRVLLLGAGEVGEGAAKALRDAGVEQILVANRTRERAEELAQRMHGQAIALEDLDDALVDVDVLLTSTGATDIVIQRSDIEAVMERRNGRELLVVDVAVPHDVDPGAGSVPGVTLFDIDDLRSVTRESEALREIEAESVQAIVVEELERYRTERRAREVAPLIATMRDRADAVRRGELDRYRAKLADLSPESRAAVEALTEGIVNKLLHEPTVRVKDVAGTVRGEQLAEALVELFRLDDR